jgi:hypothetical protein
MRKTYVIDGIKYVVVEREAEVGDYVVIVDAWLSHSKYANGDIIEVQRAFEDGIENDLVKAVDNESGYITSREYVVIEPLDIDETQDQTDILANLARRVASLEQQLRDTQRNLETFAEQTESNTKDIRTLDERTNEFTTTSKSGAKLLAESFDALARYEKSVRR